MIVKIEEAQRPACRMLNGRGMQKTSWGASLEEGLMKLIILAIAACVPLCGLAQVSELSDHTRPRAKVQTFHAKCASGRLGIIRFDPTGTPPKVCAAVQDGSRVEQCSAATSETAAAVIKATAEDLCR